MKLGELLETLGYGTMIEVVNMKADTEVYKGTVDQYSGSLMVEVWNVNIVGGILVIDVE